MAWLAICLLPRTSNYQCCSTHSLLFLVQILARFWEASLINIITGELTGKDPSTAVSKLIMSRRWVFYVLIIWSGMLTVIYAVFIPETYAPLLLRRQAKEKAAESDTDAPSVNNGWRTILTTLKMACSVPFKLLFQEYMVTCLCLLTAVLLGVQYLLFGAFSYAFAKVYDFDQSQIGLSFLGIGIGAIIAGATFPIWNGIRRRQLAANNGEREPEFRLPPAAFGAILLPVSLFWFGWTMRSSIHWIVPIVGSGLFGMGGLLIFNGVWTFLVESYPTYAASALGANAFSRLVFAAAFPLFGVQSQCSTSI